MALEVRVLVALAERELLHQLVALQLLTQAVVEVVHLTAQ
jgi:hypothetical protein